MDKSVNIHMYKYEMYKWCNDNYCNGRYKFSPCVPDTL